MAWTSCVVEHRKANPSARHRHRTVAAGATKREILLMMEIYRAHAGKVNAAGKLTSVPDLPFRSRFNRGSLLEWVDAPCPLPRLIRTHSNSCHFAKPHVERLPESR